ncbi:MAG: hypothetical protein ACLGPL_04390, partial [Acidobacteriota bacterium]
IGEQLEILITRRDLPEGGRTQYLERLRSNVRRVLGFGARVQLVEPERLPKEGLIYKTVFKSDPTFCTMD